MLMNAEGGRGLVHVTLEFLLRTLRSQYNAKYVVCTRCSCSRSDGRALPAGVGHSPHTSEAKSARCWATPTPGPTGHCAGAVSV